MKALILVDLQNDFLNGGSLAVPNSNEIIEKINDIIPNYDLVVATMDSHPKDHKSFASNNGVEVGTMGKLNGQDQIMWPDHCVKSTYGWNLSKDLNTILINEIVKKGENKEVDSYSGFLDNDGVSKTKLDQVLKSHNVTDIDVVGLALDYCVKFTCIDGVKLGYHVTLLSDLTRAVNITENDGKNAIKELQEAGVNVKESNV